MKEPAWVLPEVVMAVHQMLLAEHGGATGVRDRALLDSALSRPQQRFAYANEISIFDLAASYCYVLVKNHPFVVVTLLLPYLFRQCFLIFTSIHSLLLNPILL